MCIRDRYTNARDLFYWPAGRTGADINDDNFAAAVIVAEIDEDNPMANAFWNYIGATERRTTSPSNSTTGDEDPTTEFIEDLFAQFGALSPDIEDLPGVARIITMNAFQLFLMSYDISGINAANSYIKSVDDGIPESHQEGVTFTPGLDTSPSDVLYLLLV